VWAIEDGDGWALVDTGVRTEETVSAWEKLFAQPPFDRPLTRVFVTHMHPDHIGMAGWLTRKYGVQLWISRLEYLTCRVVVSDTGREAPADALRFYQEAGWSDERHRRLPRALRQLRQEHLRAAGQLPAARRRQVVRIGAHDWEVVGGNGHSPEHACLYCPALKLLISGDQVLPKISSNVSVQPIEPDANPMADWMASLDKVQARVPDDVLVLPAHNDCFHGLHARIDALTLPRCNLRPTTRL
jgi:glyoxylase-like metal-dependent hydrolase (beta-lactamase superfamily II)